MTTPGIPEQPRPVVENAHQQTTVVRIIAAANMVLAAMPFTLQAFDVIDWTGDQVIAFSFFLGVLTTAALLLVGQSVKSNALTVEAQVTPVVSPRDNEGAPFVPVASDGITDEEEATLDGENAADGGIA